MVKNLHAMQEAQIQSLGWKDPPRVENGNLLQYSCLENCSDREARQAPVYKPQRAGHKWATNILMLGLVIARYISIITYFPIYLLSKQNIYFCSCVWGPPRSLHKDFVKGRFTIKLEIWNMCVPLISWLTLPFFPIILRGP